MNCLSDCGNAVLAFFIKAGDAACCPWQCAEDLTPTYTVEDIILNYDILLALGLLKNCGTTTASAKISPSCMGGIQTGSIGGAEGSVVAVLKQQLLEARGAHALAVAEAEDALNNKRQPGGVAPKK